MSRKNWTTEQKKEYERRVTKIKQVHPDRFYPSEHHRTMVAIEGLMVTTLSKFYQEFEKAAWPFIPWGTELPKGIRQHIERALPHVAALGDKEACETLRNNFKISINSKDDEGNTALLRAIERRRLGVAEWALSRGAKILPNKRGWNPVLLACYTGCVPALNMFQHYGIDLNQPYSYWVWDKKIPCKRFYYPIEVAVYSNQPQAPKAVQWLIDHNVSIDNQKKGNFSIRETLQKKPELFQPEIREILVRKVTETPGLQKHISEKKRRYLIVTDYFQK